MSKEVYRLEIPIVIADEYSKEIKKIQDALKGLNKNKTKIDVDEKEARRKIEEIQKKMRELAKSKSKAKVEVDTKSASKQVDDVQKKMSGFQRTISRIQRINLSVRDNASRMVMRVQQRLDRIRNSRVGQITLTAVDKTRGVFSSVRRAITSLPGMVTIGIGVVGGAKVASGIKNIISDSMQSAMDWEVNEVAMMHRLNDNEKLGKEYMSKIGQLADSTPYSSPDLIPAFTQGLTLSKKDPKQAFEYTKIAADMAALTPGRSPEDAMSALLGASMGNYDMLEAYGFKITQEIAEGMGGFSGVFDAIVEEYQGGAAKLAKTNFGIISTLKGYQGSLKRSFGQGLLAPVGVELQRIGKFIDNNQEGWGKIKDTVSAVGLGIGTYVVGGLKNTGGYVTKLAGMLTKGIEIERDEETGAILNSKEVGQQAFQNLQETKDKVLEDMSNWWDTTGRTKAVEIGTSLGEGVVDAIVAGIPMIATAIGDMLKDKVTEAVKNPSASTIGGAAVAMGGTALLGSKMLKPVGGYRGAAKGIGSAGKGVAKGIGGIGRGIGGLIGGIGNILTFGERRKPRGSTFYEQDRRAREYSTRPENYRPPQQTQRRAGGSGSGSPHNLGFASGGPMSFMPKWMQGGGGKLLKGVGGKIPGLNMVLGGVDAYSGWKDADRRAGGEAGGFDKVASSLATIAEGFTFGLLDGDKTYEKLGGKTKEKGSIQEKAEETQMPVKEMEETGGFDAFGEEMNALVESVTSARETFESMNDGLEGMDEFTESFSAVSEMFESLQERMEAFEELAEPMESFGENFTAISEMLEEAREGLEQFSETMAEPAEQLSEALPQIAEQIVEMQERLEEFSEMITEPAEQMAEAFPLLAEQIVEMQERLEEFSEMVSEPADQFVESFSQVSEMMEQMRERLEEFSEATAEPSEMYVQNLTMMAELLEQSTEIVTDMNETISEQSALLGENMTVLGENLLQSGQIVQEGFSAIGAKAQEVVAALNTLIGHINTGAQAMSGLQQVQTHVSALNTALSNLTSRVANVQVPSSIGSGGGPVKAYAKGGIATSPHIGLVAEAGVPEAMIPFDGSQRSKDLWMTTGHALGMFDTSTSSEVNPHALDPIDTSESTTPTSSGGVVINNDIPIDIKSEGNKENIIKETLREVEQKLRLVLETT